MRIEKKIIPAVYVPAHIETMKIYEYSELADDVKDRLRKEAFDSLDIYDIMDSWENTVKAIGKLIGAEKPSYEIGYCCHNYLRFIFDELEGEISGPRAMAWIQNNWIDKAYKGKYFSTPFRKCEKSKEHPAGITYKYRYSKIMVALDNCPFTGVCYDCNFGEAWTEFKEGIRQGKQLTINDFLEILEQKLVSDISQEIDYRFSNEGIDEELSENEYYENGEAV
ncbi:hypothetical protein SELR_pSRC300490 (plasmid) [Selenomonas ruminantium subsp. lactilytica TAM6421]|uniref:Uncharacterized protein n=1 Tax=Selenomonas ruminantium subsp. lactilytica (strain NBRC 103574 / TAM6421) TaxID=927704 RepID=I0GWI5_SELRL|nr:hypothetical protein [Selenomonas ruminantium]BAL85122.1 hypothetical protein SELR_pSRC300490 [Selenomonas ruminantium subsp. lactilytica TAM6421]